MHKICNIRMRVTLNFTDIVISIFFSVHCAQEWTITFQAAVFAVQRCLLTFCHRWNASSMLNPRYWIRKDNEKWKVARCNNCGIWTTFRVYFPFVFFSVLLNSEMVLSFYNMQFPNIIHLFIQKITKRIVHGIIREQELLSGIRIIKFSSYYSKKLHLLSTWHSILSKRSWFPHGSGGWNH